MTEKPFKCECGKEYSKEITYRRHCKQKHNQVFTPKKRGPVRTYLPNIDEKERKQRRSKEWYETNKEKRQNKGRAFRLSIQMQKKRLQ